MTIFKHLQSGLKGKPSFPSQHPKQIPLFTSSVGILENLGIWKYPRQDSPPVTKQHMVLTALEHLAGQGASPVDNSVDDNFSLNQHTNKISGRGDSSQVSFYISLVTITTLYSLSTKCFCFLAWKQFCLNSELCFEIKEQRLGRFMVRGNIPDVSEIAFLKKFRKRVLCFLLGR